MKIETSTQDHPHCFGLRDSNHRPTQSCHSCSHDHDCMLTTALAEIDPSVEIDWGDVESANTAMTGKHDDGAAKVVFALTPTKAKSLTKESPAKPPVTEVYSFNGIENRADFLAMSDEQLENAHTRICERTYSRSKSPESYWGVRAEFCAASIVLNERGLRPPRFRSACHSVAWKPSMTWSEEMKTMSKDMMIIDLHHLHCFGIRSTVDDYEFKNLLTNDIFDFELAARFVSAKWKKQARVDKLLTLSDVEQWQCRKLASASFEKRWKDVVNQSAAVEQRLKSAAYRNPRLNPEIQDYTRLWIADTICADGNQRLIGLFHGWQRGAKPLAQSTLSSKLKTMRRWTKPS